MTDAVKLPDDILQRSEHNSYLMAQCANYCAGCLRPFQTGMPIFSFGDVDTVIAKVEWKCGICGTADLTALKQPSTVTIYLLERHRGQLLSDIEPEVRNAIEEGFQLVERLRSNMQGAVQLTEQQNEA